MRGLGIRWMGPFKAGAAWAAALVPTVAWVVWAASVALAGTPGVTADTIRIGTFQALTGPAAPIGTEFVRGMRTYFAWVNDQGGVNGRKIELLVENDEFKPANTVALVRKLVEQDQVFAIVGGLGTPTSLAVLDYLVQQEVPFVYQASGVSAFAYPPKRTVFAVQPNYTVEGRIIARYAVETLGSQRLAIMYENDDMGKEGLGGVEAYMASKGLKLAAAIPFNFGETTFATHVLKLRQANPDAIIIYGLQQPTVNILKEIDRQGVKAARFASYITADLNLLKLAGEAAEGLMMTGWVPILSPDDPDAARYLEVVSQYNPDYKGTPSGFLAAGWVAAEIFTEGVRRAGRNLTRESLIAALESMEHWNGIIAKDITYGPNQRAGKVSLYFLKVEKGNFVAISGWVEM